MPSTKRTHDESAAQTEGAESISVQPVDATEHSTDDAVAASEVAEPQAKKAKLDVDSTQAASGESTPADAEKPALKKLPKRKLALFIGYNGANYDGLYVNPGKNTIEKNLHEALCRAGAIEPHNADKFQKVHWMRASRTDKKVHALINVIALTAAMVTEDLQELAYLVNAQLPTDIRVLGIYRVVKSFDPKACCDSRLYEYIVPSYSLKHTGKLAEPLASIDESAPMDYRVSAEQIAELNRILAKYKGTKSFHNYTDRSRYSKTQVKRYIINFWCEPYPIMVDGVECLVLKVHGYSFMLHYIRMMVGSACAILRGMLDESDFDKSFEPDTILRLPTIPGIGLLLADLYFDGFNKRHGATHGEVSTKEFAANIDGFRQQLFEYIIKLEKETRVIADFVHQKMIYTITGTGKDAARGAAEGQEEDDAEVLED